jgi:lysine decarboxylase
MIHVQGSRLDIPRLEQAIGMLQTTSPLLPILASLDAARRQMAIDGPSLLARTIALARQARNSLRQVPGLAVIDDRSLGLSRDHYDPTRLLVDVQGLGLSGFEVESILRERFRIAPEMSDAATVLFLVTIGDNPDSIARLLHALESIATDDRSGPVVRTAPQHACADVLAPGRQVMTPRQAWFASQRTVPIASAIGEVSAEVITVYPPGIPILMPGEVITRDQLAYLAACARSGAHITGAADPALSSIRIVAGTPAQ